MSLDMFFKEKNEKKKNLLEVRRVLKPVGDIIS